MLFIVLFAVCTYSINQVYIDSWVELIVWVIVLSVLINGILFLIYKGTEEYVYLKKIVFNFIKKKRSV